MLRRQWPPAECTCPAAAATPPPDGAPEEPLPHILLKNWIVLSLRSPLFEMFSEPRLRNRTIRPRARDMATLNRCSYLARPFTLREIIFSRYDIVIRFDILVVSRKSFFHDQVCAPAACSQEMVGRYVAPLLLVPSFDPADARRWPRLGAEVFVEEVPPVTIITTTSPWL